MSLPDQKYDAAKERAFSEHYPSDWISEMPAEDCRNLLLQLWITYIAAYEPGPLIWKHQRVCDVLTDAATKACTRYAEEHVESHLEEGEEF